MLAAVVFGFASGNWVALLFCFVVVVVLFYVLVRYSLDPDRLRARQSERILALAAQTLTALRAGLTETSAQMVCALLLPATSANAIVITDRQAVLGLAGSISPELTAGLSVETQSTQSVLSSGQVEVTKEFAELSETERAAGFAAVITVPLVLHEQVLGTLKFHYRRLHRIDETEQAMALGLGNLLSMQLNLAELEKQRELASRMELKALQAQINPHFLFNTINTIASLIRTDPAQARVLLREFAAFYRYTLEGSLELISLEQEYLQTLRYLGFMIARFGAERIISEGFIEPGLEQIQVPAFIIQPVVENAVTHAFRDLEPLHISIKAFSQAGEVLVEVFDDGIGMDAETLAHLFDDDSLHRNIALRNVNNRLRGFFGNETGLQIESKQGYGTLVRLHLGPLVQFKAGEL